VKKSLCALAVALFIMPQWSGAASLSSYDEEGGESYSTLEAEAPTAKEESVNYEEASTAPAVIAPPAEKKSLDVAKNTVYLYPLSLIFTTGIDFFPTFVYVGWERMLSASGALFLRPGVGFGTFEPIDTEITFLSLSLLGGYRYYLNGETGQGAFLQPSLSGSYTSMSIEGADAKIEGSGPVAALMLYVGHSAKWKTLSMYIDAGIGYQFGSVEVEDDDGDYISYSSAGVAWDVSWGLGINF